MAIKSYTCDLCGDDINNDGFHVTIADMTDTLDSKDDQWCSKCMSMVRSYIRHGLPPVPSFDK